MGCEHRGHLGKFVVEVEESPSAHPLMKLRHHFIPRVQLVPREAFDEPARGIPEEGGFDVIPLAGNGVEFEPFPEAAEDLILFRHEGSKIQDDRNGIAGDLPPADLDAEAFVHGLLFPGLEQHPVLLEFGIFPCFPPDVRPDEDMPVLEFFL